MKKYIKPLFFIVIIVILLLFIPPLIEGFDDCIIDTLANLKMDIAEIKEELKKKDTPVDTPIPDEHVELANQSEETYDELNDNIADALNTI